MCESQGRIGGGDLLVEYDVFSCGVCSKGIRKTVCVFGAEKLLTQDIHRTILPLPDNLCDLGPIKNVACGSTAINTEMPASEESESVSSYKMANGKWGPQGSPPVSKDEVNAENHPGIEFSFPLG